MSKQSLADDSCFISIELAGKPVNERSATIKVYSRVDKKPDSKNDATDDLFN